MAAGLHPISLMFPKSYWLSFDGSSWNSHGGTGTGTTTNGSVTWSGITNVRRFYFGQSGLVAEHHPTSQQLYYFEFCHIKLAAVTGAVSYDVDYRLPSRSMDKCSTATTSTSVNLSGLSPSAIYDWRVRANCSSGVIILKAGINFTTATHSLDSMQ